jgi:hypothetical protein
MRWNRLLAVLGGVLLGVSAFLTWFELPAVKFNANEIPALILFRYATTATGFKLGYVLLALGVALIAAAFLRPPAQGGVVLVLGALGLAVVIDFIAQLLRELNNTPHEGSLLDYLKYGAFVAGAGGLLSLVGAFGGLARAEVVLEPDYERPHWASADLVGSGPSPWDAPAEAAPNAAGSADHWDVPVAPPPMSAPPEPSTTPATQSWSPPTEVVPAVTPNRANPWDAPAPVAPAVTKAPERGVEPATATESGSPLTEVTPAVSDAPCPNCGRPTETARNFCNFCGGRLA